MAPLVGIVLSKCMPKRSKLDWFANCCNPSLGLTTKARVCKGAGQEGSSGIISHALRSVGECERMNLHTPK
jgi:hypothetical protein